MTVAPETPPRGIDPGWWTAFRRRCNDLAARADRGSTRERARLERGARRALLVVEHGTVMADLIEEASRPFDLSTVRPCRSGVRKFRRPAGELVAAGGKQDRRRPRGYVCTARPDGTFAVMTPMGVPVPGVTLTAAGDVVEAPGVCACGCGAVVEHVP